MRGRILIVSMWVVVATLCATAIAGAQQNASIAGVITDEAKLAVPGVVVTAVDMASGRQVTATTDAAGEFRLMNLPPSRYRISAELPGFETATREVQVLVGQRAEVPLLMKIAGVAETVLVTGESPLVNIRSSEVAGNVDRRQMEELPLAGRNWMELSLQIKGITANNVDQRPGIERDEQFQLNLDGQQVTQKNASSSFGQPKFSREAIAEFQIVTNMFDITQGRSSGGQVQAISKSGSNELAGSLYGYFRDDKLNAADHVAGRVLTYANQQVGGAVGGPIVRDRLHFFATYEYEREPNTVFVQPNLLSNQRFSFENIVRQNSLLGRVDHTASTRDRFSYRFSQWNARRPFEVSPTQHPTQAGDRTREAMNVLGTWSRVLSDRTVQEIKVGFNNFAWANNVAVQSVANVPILRFTTVNIGATRDWPSNFDQKVWSARYDLTAVRSNHEFKVGGEFLGWRDTGEWHLLERGEFRFASNPPDMDRRFPADAWDDPSRWDLSGLDARVQLFDQSFGDFTIDIPRPTFAVWFGDTWRMSDRLTVNYGVRWDEDWGATAPPYVTTQVPFVPFNGPLFNHEIRDHNNVAPRVGFAYNVGSTNELVIRGGTGLYFSVPVTNVTYSQQRDNGERIVAATFANDGRPGFILDPRRGVQTADILAGRVPLPPLAPRAIAHDFQMPYTLQSSIGFQKQLTAVLGIEADLVHWGSHNDVRGRDINLFFDPATGYNLDPAVHGRPDPKFGETLWMESTGKSNYFGLSSGLTRRFKDNFQAGITHTFMFRKEDNSTAFSIQANNQFDLDEELARANDFQRNTFRTYALYRLPWDFSISAAYAFGSGNYYATSLSGRPFNKPGTNRLNTAAAVAVLESAQSRFEGPAVIPTGGLVPRNALRGDALHKVDVRITKNVRIGSNRVSLQAEVFNLLNHANFGAYNGVVNSADFGAPRQNLGNAYAPRSGQLGVRFEF
jgi:hypothetical protein